MRSDPGGQALEHAAPAAAPAGVVPAGPRSTRELAGLTLGAVGVVYGDIGTSPLYAVRECFHPTHGVPPTPENVLGILSLIFWALVLVIVVKYLTFVMRADNHGEGGILALLALVQGAGAPTSPRRRGIVLLLGLSGAALLYGDGMLTPAISVLSAVEGVGVATPGIAPAVVPLTLGVLVALFLVQRRGTARIGAWFGPIAAVWFVCIAAVGIPWIVREPGILAALSPTHAIGFLAAGHGQAWFVLGAVVLCITGGEALFADMGHFGRRPIVLAWYSVVFPALLLNYFGQGALLLREGTAPASPFYALVPAPLLYPMVGIATLATVVASQAVISGAFSLTRQAVQLGFLPRMRIVHTSSRTEGQIYVPLVNTGLMLACVALVLGFRSSSGLAGAYGLAVIGVMTSTTLLYASVARARFGVLRAAALASLFLAVELAFLATNATKLVHGGWFPICIGLALLAIMVAWKTGYERLDRQLRAGTLPLDRFVVDVRETRPLRVPGIAVFLGGYPGSVPPALLHHFKHSKVLHEQVIVLSIVTEPVPVVPGPARVEVEDLGEGFAKVTAHYGFMQTPTIQEVLWRCAAAGLAVSVEQASFFLGRVTVLPSAGAGPLGWRQRLFGFLHQTAQSATVFFGIPPSRVVELGMQVRI